MLLSAGDFLMSQSLIDELASAAGYRRLQRLCEAGNYVVVPAFEVLLDRNTVEDESSKNVQLETALRKARAIVQQSKLHLLQALPQGWLAPFGFWRNFTNGHGPTDFTRYILHKDHRHMHLLEILFGLDACERRKTESKLVFAQSALHTLIPWS